MILTIWTVKAKPGKMEEFRQALREYDLADRPAGCKETLPVVDLAVDQLMADPARPDVVSIVQRWTTREAAMAAGGGEQRMQFMSRLGHYIETASVRFYQTLDET